MLAMHVLTPLDDALLCLFVRLHSPFACSPMVTRELFVLCCRSLFVQVGLLNRLGFVCSVFSPFFMFSSPVGETEGAQAYTPCVNCLGLL